MHRLIIIFGLSDISRMIIPLSWVLTKKHSGLYHAPHRWRRHQTVKFSAFYERNSPSPVGSPHKASGVELWWWDTSDLRRHGTHCDVILINSHGIKICFVVITLLWITPAYPYVCRPANGIMVADVSTDDFRYISAKCSAFHQWPQCRHNWVLTFTYSSNISMYRSEDTNIPWWCVIANTSVNWHQITKMYLSNMWHSTTEQRTPKVNYIYKKYDNTQS